MGMFDDVHLEYEAPDLPGIPRDFQTKSLDPSMTEYIISKEGRLLRKPWGKFRSPFDPKPEVPEEPEPLEPPLDMEFHGDIRIYASDGKPGGDFKEYIVRFTHGTLEWIRPIAEVPELLRSRVW